jgi:hypothetical protein
MYALLQYFARRIQFFSILVFGETTSTEHRISVLVLILFSRIVSEKAASSVVESDGVGDGDGSRQTLLFSLCERPRRAFGTSRFGFSGLFGFILLSCLNKFLQGDFVNSFAVPPRGFGLSSGLAPD